MSLRACVAVQARWRSTMSDALLSRQRSARLHAHPASTPRGSAPLTRPSSKSRSRCYTDSQAPGACAHIRMEPKRRALESIVNNQPAKPAEPARRKIRHYPQLSSRLKGSAHKSPHSRSKSNRACRGKKDRKAVEKNWLPTCMPLELFLPITPNLLPTRTQPSRL